MLSTITINIKWWKWLCYLAQNNRRRFYEKCSCVTEWLDLQLKERCFRPQARFLVALPITQSICQRILFLPYASTKQRKISAFIIFIPAVRKHYCKGDETEKKYQSRQKMSSIIPNASFSSNQRDPFIMFLLCRAASRK